MKKRETVKFNRKLKKAREAGRKQAFEEMKKELLKLLPISQQVVDYTDSGMDVTIHADVSSKEYLKILRRK